jgi:putative Holliday junction resolvase
VKVVLGLDVGDARIGLARGEVGSSLAFGRGFIARRTLREDVAAVREAAAREGAELVVVGLPKRLAGSDSPQTQKVRAFAEALEGAGLEVAFEDERFTTKLATRGIAHSGLPKAKRQEKGRVDEVAAVLLLESYLARMAHAPEG